MPGFGHVPLFKGSVGNGATQYVPVPIHDGCIGVQIAWLDATSSATITLELTSFDAYDAPYDAAGAAYEWKDSGVSITGPAASAAGSSLVNCENVRQLRARLKIVGAAASLFEIRDGLQGL
jgi:hypothetical protein